MQSNTITLDKVSVYYGDFRAVEDVSMDIRAKAITAFIGPSGCGKSTILRCFNRMNDLIEGARVTGAVRIDGTDIYARHQNLIALRRKVGMVFQRPNPFPLSIYENCVYGPTVHGMTSRHTLNEINRQVLTSVGLWEEVKGRLHESALELTDEQQQRLCIARCLALNPEILLMDEPCSTLDPIATQRIEALILQLRQQFTIIIVTHNMQQAQRISDFTGFFLLGELVEFGPTPTVFRKPQHKRTKDYLEGKFG